MGFVVGVIILLVVCACFYGLTTENKFVASEELVNNAWSSIDVVQENRYDTLVELYKIVASYDEHESETLAEIVRNRGLKSNDNRIGELLTKVYAVAEAYPELKADKLYMDLMGKLTELNAQTKFAKLVYNDAVTKFNRLVKMVPSNFVASMFNHEEKDYLTVETEKKVMPDFNAYRNR